MVIHYKLSLTMIVTDSNDNLKGIFTQLVYFQIQLENF